MTTETIFGSYNDFILIEGKTITVNIPQDSFANEEFVLIIKTIIANSETKEKLIATAIPVTITPPCDSKSAPQISPSAGNTLSVLGELCLSFNLLIKFNGVV